MARASRPTPHVVARDLVKRYGALEAVAGVSFQIRPGECFGFLGPNGAGKTTTLKMMLGLSPFESGTLEVLGRPVPGEDREVRREVGVVPQDDNLDPDLSVLENLIAYARYYDLTGAPARGRAHELLRFVQLEDRAANSIDSLSGGMRRRLIIARALLHRPRLLVLDEPTTGLDPQARHLVWERLRELRGRGVTLVLTTHYMDEAEHLCDRLVVMDAGKILVEGPPALLIRRHVGRRVVELNLTGSAEAVGVAEALERRRMPHQRSGDAVYVYSRGAADGGWERAALRGMRPVRRVERDANLEDVFLKLTGRELKE